MVRPITVKKSRWPFNDFGRTTRRSYNDHTPHQIVATVKDHARPERMPLAATLAIQYGTASSGNAQSGFSWYSATNTGSPEQAPMIFNDVAARPTRARKRAIPEMSKWTIEADPFIKLPGPVANLIQSTLHSKAAVSPLRPWR